MLRCVTLAAAIFAASLPAAAQVQRNFPANALRGEIRFLQPPEVLLNGQPARLAPGARIRGQNNMLQMSGALVDSGAVVNYTQENTPEIAVRPWPTNAEQAKTWLFDAAAQTWTRP
jgi:hypothetical protein